MLVDQLDTGLVTTLRPEQIPPGAATVADNVRFYPKCVRNELGWKRIYNDRFSEAAVRLDGKSNYFFGRLHATGTDLTLQTTAWTVECFFTPDLIPTGASSIETLLYKGNDSNSPAASSQFDWSLYLEYTSSNWLLKFAIDGSTSVGQVTISTDSGGALIFPGVRYHAVFGRDGSDYYLYLHRVGTTMGSRSTTAVAGIGNVTDSANSDFYIGAVPNSSGYRIYDRGIYHFAGVIQEVRVWKTVVRSTSDLETYDDTQVGVTPDAGWRLTGWNGPTWAATWGSVPTLDLMPIDSKWSTISGSNAIAFNGHSGGFPIRDSYSLRAPSLSTKGFEGEIDAPATFGYFAKIRPDDIAERAIHQWVHFTDDEEHRTNWPPAPSSGTHLNGELTLGGTPEIGNTCLQIVPYSGSTYIRFVVWIYNKTVSQYEAYGVSSAAISAATTYNIVAFVDQTNMQARLFINGAETASSPISIKSSTTGGAAAGDVRYLPRTSDTPQGSRVKYWMSIGRAIKDSRRGDDFPGDPNDVDVRYHYDKTFYGAIRQFGYIANLTNPLHVAQFLNANDVSRETVRSLNGQVLTCFPMTEGRGDELQDFGLNVIGAALRVDPGHQQAESLITTSTKAKPTLIANHSYRNPDESDGTSEKAIVVAGATVYEASGGLAESSVTFTKLCEGIRNDDQRKISMAKWRDSLILCTGTANHHIWRNRVFSLHIAPPSGFLGFGLTDQGSKRANLGPGVYRYAVAYYSKFTGKWSPVGLFAQVEIKKGKANVAFGSGQEIRQTYPSTGDSINKADFDLSDASCIIRGNAWYGTTGSKAGTDPGYYESGIGSGGTNAAKYKRIVFVNDDKEKNSLIKTKKDVTEYEVQAVIEERALKLFVERRPDGKVEIFGSFPGTHGFLQLANQSGGKNMIGESAGVIGFTGVSSGSPLEKQWQGDGETDGPPLPFSSDPQVTHVGFFRTTANGEDFRLLKLIPNGDTSFIDSLPDEELVGELLKISAGAPPPCRYVFLHESRAFYFGNEDHPQRLWFSKAGEPWNVPPQQVVDITDGDTLQLLGAGAAEGIMALFKKNRTFVLNPGGGGSLPFSIETKVNDQGCTSPFGVTSVGSKIFYPSPQSFMRFDASAAIPVSRHIKPTWDAFPPSHREQIVGAHYRDEEEVHFLIPTGDTSVDGTVVCDSELVLSYGTDSQASWHRNTGIYGDIIASIQGSDGKFRLYMLDSFGFLSVRGEYGAYGPDTAIVASKTIQTGSTTTIRVTTLASATYPHGYLGMPVTVVFADGTRETRLVTADSLGSPNSILTLDRALSQSTISGGQTAIFGSKEARYVTGYVGLEEPNVTQVNGIFLLFEPQTVAADITVKLAGKEGQDSNDAATSITVPNTVRSRFSKNLKSRGRYHEIEVDARGVSKNFELKSFGYDYEKADRGKAH